MRTLKDIDDPIFVKKAKLNALERFSMRFIKDERDLPFIYLILQISFILLPLGILLFTPVLQGAYWWAAAITHMLLIAAVYLGPYTLMLHNTSHRKFFKPQFEILNYYIPWILGPFMGQSPETYFSHHIGMHHAENNMLDDKSSTLYYQRDSFFHFMQYFGVFLTIGIAQLVDYFRKKQRSLFLKKAVRGELSFFIFAGIMLYFNNAATLVVFIFPFFVCRFGMMAGNWAQHAFINEKDPENNYWNSITLINSTYNKKCFNDGYHIGHHLRPSMHWTDMPIDFQKNKDKYAENKAIVFEGMDFTIVWFWLMCKRYDVLADRFVNINNQYKSKEEIIDFLKSRTKKFEWKKLKQAA